MLKKNMQNFSFSKLFTSFIISLYLLSFSDRAYSQEKLYVASQTTTSLNRLYIPLYEEFEQKTGIKVIRIRVDDIKEFDNEKTWFAYNGEPIDVINGQITSRLIRYYQQGKLRPLNDFWQKHQLESDFSHIKDVLIYQDKILALPHSIYTWQIFYAKSIFKNGFTPPKTLDELINVCIVLNKRNIVPFHIMDKTPWSQMAWFEYLILRIHGITFYNDLTEGKVPYTGEKVRVVMHYWQELINANCFSDKYGSMNWQNAIPYMLRGMVAMIFNGPGVLGKLKLPEHKAAIDFFSFPKIKDIPRYETAPVNAFHASNLSNKKGAIDKFLYFMSQPEVHEALTHPFLVIPANSRSNPPPTRNGRRFIEELLQSSGTSTFFDRKVLPKFEIDSRPYFVEIVETGDIDHFMVNLERLRILHYQKNIK